METRSTIRVKFNFAKQIIEIVVNFLNFETFAQHGEQTTDETVSIELARHTRDTGGRCRKFKIEFPASVLVRIHRIVQAGKSLDAATISDIIPISIIDK